MAEERTAASSHDRIDEIEKGMVAMEAVLKYQFKDLFFRVKRMEGIMLAAAGAIIALLVAVLMKMG